MLGSATEVAVMVALPAETPVTRPELLTVATASLEEDQVTASETTPVLLTVAVSCRVCPSLTLVEPPVTVTELICPALTVTSRNPDFEPSTVEVAVMRTVPSAMPWTRPELLTVAMPLSWEDQVTVVAKSPSLTTFALSWISSPIRTVWYTARLSRRRR